VTEGTAAYVRWNGTLATGTRLWAVAGDELRRLRTNSWGFFVVAAGLTWGIASAVQLYQFRNAGDAHNLDAFVAMMNQLLWFVLAAAAVIGAPSILDDARRGALELYMARPLTRWEYLGGKAVALLGLCMSMFAGSILIYTVAAYGFFDQQPDGWTWAPLAGLAFGALWSLLAVGAALGISCVARSGRAAAILLFGGAVVAHVTAGTVLPQLTESSWLSIFSPFNAMAGLTPWLWPNATLVASDFPPWWGLTEILVLAAVGWALVAWRHPRVRGEDS
jgi:ABC-type transport system involved in multi-copper enzyme maturation permease subunit